MAKGKKVKKPSFTIHLMPAEGDPIKVIDEIIQDRIKSVLRKHNAVLYNKDIRNHTTGVIGYERKGEIICESIDSEGFAEG